MGRDRTLKQLFETNRLWSARIREQDPRFFRKLARQQSPDYLWIGCSDSRVPANQIVGLLPGELFVHRNVGNLVVHTDLNCLTVMQFAVEVLRVRHIIVCGHYGCSGVDAALRRDRIGLADNWLRHIQDVRAKHRARFARNTGARSSKRTMLDRLCELNVIEQVANVCQSSIARDAWERGQELTVHGWIYGIGDGLLRDLSVTVTGLAGARAAYQTALRALGDG
ncbi:MAG: carbonate dehydratase [Gammaproteobacteria bacterium]|nr:carbonate dehydratase [Gammaproteobacteria bacterium]